MQSTQLKERPAPIRFLFYLALAVLIPFIGACIAVYLGWRDPARWIRYTTRGILLFWVGLVILGLILSATGAIPSTRR